MNLRLICLLFILIGGWQPIKAQSSEFVDTHRGNGIRVMFYNVENLFDTYDDPDVEDDDFTGQGAMKWDSLKLNRKLNNLSKVIIGVGGWQLPEIVGLAEVENRCCLDLLLNNTALKASDYAYIHYDSPDSRGIDVALLYRTSCFRPINHQFVRVSETGLVTRDILYVNGLVNDHDTLHILVNHWPSRYGGQYASEPKRESVATVLHGFLDSLQSVHPKGKVLIMGDFNDEPDDLSIQVLTQSVRLDLLNTMHCAVENKTGTYAMGQEELDWEVIDQIIISQSLMDNDGLSVYDPCARVYRPEWLLDKDGKPKRALKGSFFTYGFSDHLPVYIDLEDSQIKRASH